MSHFQTTPKIPLKTGADGKDYVDYKATDELRRMMTPNGKIYSRKRLSASSQEQRRVSQAHQASQVHVAAAVHLGNALS